MKKLIIVGLIGVAVWQWQQRQPTEVSYSQPSVVTAAQAAPAPSSPGFSCDGRQHCSQMTSRAEAEYFNRYCPNTKMDGDHDGHPCEGDSRF